MKKVYIIKVGPGWRHDKYDDVNMSPDNVYDDYFSAFEIHLNTEITK